MELAASLQGALPAISLTSHLTLSTALGNDVDGCFVFAQQLYGLGQPGDALLCITTSGNAENVRNAAIVARSLGIQVIGLTGRSGGKLKALSDLCICAPADETYRVQEYHLPIYHALCEALEWHFFLP